MQDAVAGFDMDQKAVTSKSSCETCCEGKQSRLSFPSSGNRSTQLLEVVHSDVCGPMETVSLGGSRYYIIFVDDYSRMTHIYFMKNKSESFQCFRDYVAHVENGLSKKIKILRSDNGGEFCSHEFENYLKQKGITHQKTNSYTPEQNGLSERMNRTIVEKARCLLFDAGLKKEFWAEATNTAVYLQNRTVSAVLNNKTPYELWTSKKPDISHLRVFGSTVMVHVSKQRRLKWDKKSVKCILVGYPDNIKGYRIYNPVSKSITSSRDVIIIEKELHSSNVTATVNSDVSLEDQEKKTSDSVGDGCQSDDSFVSIADNPEDPPYVPSESEELESSTESSGSVIPALPSRVRRKPERYGFSNICVLKVPV